MGKIMEAVFCVFYLIFTLVVGIKIVRNSKANREIKLYGIMSLVLVFGDAFHLVPRILTAVNAAGDYSGPAGIGKMITSITMTVFYVIMYFIYTMRYDRTNKVMQYSIVGLAIVRIALCLLPQNEWTGDAPVIWGIYRNIPFAIIGVIMIILYYMQRSDNDYKWMWLAILLSFAFYIPVVLWADINPMIGMLMLPKTCMYMWIVMMGYKVSKQS